MNILKKTNDTRCRRTQWMLKGMWKSSVLYVAFICCGARLMNGTSYFQEAILHLGRYASQPLVRLWVDNAERKWVEQYTLNVYLFAFLFFFWSCCGLRPRPRLPQKQTWNVFTEFLFCYLFVVVKKKKLNLLFLMLIKGWSFIICQKYLDVFCLFTIIAK